MLVVVHGFSAQMIAGRVLAGLATVVTETKKAPRGLTIMVERIRITDGGRRALEGWTIETATVHEMKAQGLGPTAIAKPCGIGRASVYRALEASH
jgi:DNA invertase Pin-like site-specific DNA recombinase